MESIQADVKYFVRHKKEFLKLRIDLRKIQSLILERIPILYPAIPGVPNESGLDFYDELSKLDFETLQQFLKVLKLAEYDIEAEWLENNLPDPYQYKMRPKSLGACLIINNISSPQESPSLEGRDEGVRVLATVLETIGYRVVCVNDLSAQDMRNTLNYFSQSLEEFNYDSLLTIISTHGNTTENGDVLYGHNRDMDREFIYKDEIYEMFSNQNCPHMKGKPKMFFFQACRGEKSFKTCPLEKFFTDAHGHGELKYQHSIYSIHRVDPLPIMSDMIIVHSTLPGHVSLRTTHGGVFCQALAKVLRRDYRVHDLNTMLVSVNQEMAYRGCIHVEYLGAFGIVHFNSLIRGLNI